eukprot:SAG11_NODE_2386_length_3418_cov_1.215728_1_plen_87_part_00
MLHQVGCKQHEQLSTLMPLCMLVVCGIAMVYGMTLSCERRVDEMRTDVFKFVLSGPSDTPYSLGLFEFHMFCPNSFPGACKWICNH